MYQSGMPEQITRCAQNNRILCTAGFSDLLGNQYRFLSAVHMLDRGMLLPFSFLCPLDSRVILGTWNSFFDSGEGCFQQKGKTFLSLLSILISHILFIRNTYFPILIFSPWWWYPGPLPPFFSREKGSGLPIPCQLFCFRQDSAFALFFHIFFKAFFK